jgi:hyperosmotically inducible protein
MCDSVPTAPIRASILHSRFRNVRALEPLLFQPCGESIMKQISKYLSAVFLAVTLTSMVGCASTSKQEGTGQYIDDSFITAKVKAALIEDPTTKATEINVETFKGIVQLSGFVSSQAAASRALELARGVGGVKGVTNDMRLK